MFRKLIKLIRRAFFLLLLVLSLLSLSVNLAIAADPPVPMPDGQKYGNDVEEVGQLSSASQTYHTIIGVAAILVIFGAGYTLTKLYHQHNN